MGVDFRSLRHLIDIDKFCRRMGLIDASRPNDNTWNPQPRQLTGISPIRHASETGVPQQPLANSFREPDNFLLGSGLEGKIFQKRLFYADLKLRITSL